MVDPQERVVSDRSVAVLHTALQGRQISRFVSQRRTSDRHRRHNSPILCISTLASLYNYSVGFFWRVFVLLRGEVSRRFWLKLASTQARYSRKRACRSFGWNCKFAHFFLALGPACDCVSTHDGSVKGSWEDIRCVVGTTYPLVVFSPLVTCHGSAIRLLFKTSCGEDRAPL